MTTTEPQNIWPLILPDKGKGNNSYKPNPSELINLIRNGIPGSSLNNAAMLLEISQAQMCKLVHMSRTPQRCASSKLDIDKSDHLIQITKLCQRCVDVFGGKEKAIRWVKSPNHFLGDQTPLHLMDTMEGIKLVIDALIQLEYGVYA